MKKTTAKSILFLLLVMAFSAIVRAEELLTISVAGADLVNYQAEPLSNPVGGEKFKGSNFIHPLKTPSGFVVTDIQPGDHLHHFGLWWPWKYIERGDRKILFWELQKGDGIIEARESRKTDSGFVAESAYIDRRAPGGPEVIMTEKVAAAVSAVAESPARGYFLDLEIENEVDGDDPLTVSKYRYSGFALRGARSWNKDNSRVLTSAGKDYSESNNTRARWIRVEGDSIEGGRAGVLIMSCPDNRDHPERLRTWNPKMHNGAIFINFNPVQVESWRLEPGKKYVRKYRLFIYDGSVGAEEAEALWKSYAD